MRIIVNDTSIFIDLRKANLLTVTLLLPYRFQVALPLIHSELLDFSDAEIADFQARGLEVVDLPPNLVKRAMDLRASRPSLSINDCFSIALTENEADSILLTGDQTQRRHAEALGLEVHGVLWVTDELHAKELATFEALLDGLTTLEADPVVFLPEQEVRARIKILKRVLGRDDE